MSLKDKHWSRTAGEAGAPERFAKGRAKGLCTVGQMEVGRLKRGWHTEWEAEQARVSPEEVRASIERKVEAFRRQQDMTLSPRTLAARAEFERLRDEDVARRYKASEDPEHLMYVERSEEGEGTCSRSAQTAENKIPLPKMFADHTRSEIRFYGLFVGMGH